MPFWYQLPVPALDDPQPKSVRLIEWLVEEGVAVHRGKRIAIIGTPNGRYAVLTNGNGFLRERHFPPGADVDLLTPIATIAADGEDIPYGKPYSLAERLTGTAEKSSQ